MSCENRVTTHSHDEKLHKNFSINRLPQSARWDTIRILAFDKDETITPANKPIQPEMAAKLACLTRDKVVVILTARDIETCQKQILDEIKQHNPNLENLIFWCSNGSQIFHYNALDNSLSLRKELEGIIDVSRVNEAIQILNDELRESDRDMEFDPRSNTMWAFFPPREKMSDEERKNFDPGAIKRNNAIKKIREAKIFPEKYEIIAGGSTSIDVGIHNKESGMRNMLSYFQYNAERCGEIIFFWDGFPGNDSPILKVDGIHIVQVQNPEVTSSLLDQFYSTKSEIKKPTPSCKEFNN